MEVDGFDFLELLKLVMFHGNEVILLEFWTYDTWYNYLANHRMDLLNPIQFTGMKHCSI